MLTPKRVRANNIIRANGLKTKQGDGAMAESKLQANVDAFREFVHTNGWTIVEEKEIQSGYQITVADGKTRIPAAFYKSGKALIQGKEGELRTGIRSWWNGRKTSSDLPASPVSLQPALIETPSA